MNKKTPEAKIIVALSQVEELSLKKKRDILSVLPNPTDWISEKHSKTVETATAVL